MVPSCAGCPGKIIISTQDVGGQYLIAHPVAIRSSAGSTCRKDGRATGYFNSVQSPMTAPLKHNIFYLLAGLLALFISVPVIETFQGEVARVLMYAALSVTLGISVWSLSGSRTAFVAGALYTILTIVLAIVAVRMQHSLPGHLILVLHLMFWVTSAWIAARALLAPGPVDLNRIAGSVCIYLMAGFIWTYLYIFQNLLVPGSFRGISSGTLEETLPELAYHSFVTLTTLGYGDITPVTPFARTLGNLEAIFGQFYIAILVASLVGIHIANRIDQKDSTRRR